MKLRQLGPLLSLVLLGAACTSSNPHSPEPADASDVANGPADAARADANVPARDASSNMDAQVTPATDAQTPSTSDASQAEVELTSLVYVGGNGNVYPLKTFTLDRSSGALSAIDSAASFGNSPSFIRPNAEGTRLYLTNEDGSSAGITVATLDARTGVPSQLDKRNFPGGGGFVHAAIDSSGKVLIAADYNGGRAVSFLIASDGKLSESVSNVKFADKNGVSSQAHSVGIHPSGKWAYVPNKNLGIIAQFSLDAQTGKLTRLADLQSSKAEPRMISITRDGKYAYVMHEASSALNAYRIGDDGLLTEIDSKVTLPDGFKGNNTGAHCLVHPNQRFVYVSNRGANQIAGYGIGADGKLTLISQTATEGKTPRHFDIDASGAWLVVANQDSGNLLSFAIESDGKLSKRGAPVTGLTAPTVAAIVTRPK